MRPKSTEPDCGETRWAALVVEVPENLADELAGSLGQQALGVTCEPAGGGGTRLRVYYPQGQGAVPSVERAAGVLRAFGVDPDRGRPRLEPVEDGCWVERYQRGLRPFPIGRRFLVIPGDEPSAVTGGRRPIRLVPGRAFGTGEHPTTRLCVEALESVVRPGGRWLDLGTGSGILAAVAVGCGATHVTALDIDTEAVAVAREVLAANGIDRQVSLGVGSLAAVAAGSMQGVVANIAASFFVDGAAALAGALRAGGVLVASGFTLGDRDQVERALRAVGLRTGGAREQEGWIALTLRREDRR